MVERLRQIRDDLVCGCTPAETMADVEAALAEAELIERATVPYIQANR
jgi:hypothetical protein